ncbi:MAG: type II secretion system protein GspL [Candidatus Thiodiazotropha sp. (ex Ctena orbiculata)]|uniref:Type II secretion system protein L n=1 Tax=Candidatus Thiodiazotropha taylori TaxID=2792791 RepID=A0A944QUX7_9GAMM|nr:type II secretion system protein GspL [Candidatus Thiodiazotropha taylori]
MADRLIIQCHDSDCSKVSWLVKGGASPQPAEGTLADAAKLAKGRRSLVIIPATDLLITEVHIPTRNRQRLIQAIPFSLENELTENVDRLHFAAGSIDSENVTPVVVIAKQKLDDLLQTLESAGIEPIGIYADLLCLPHESDSWSLYEDNRILNVRSGGERGFSVDAINGEATLKLALQQNSEHPPHRIVLYQSPDTAEPLDLQPFEDEYDISVRRLDSLAELTGILADNLVKKQQINILQGDYQRVDKLTLQWKRWLPAAVLAAVFIALSLLLNVQEYRHYETQSIALSKQIRETFQKAFPEVKRIVDPKVQMEQKLKALRGGDAGSFMQFASLFVPAASVIKGSPNTTLESISFRDGKLDLQLVIKELQALETLKQTIEAKRLAVEIRSANATGNQVTSHIRISGVNP